MKFVEIIKFLVIILLIGLHLAQVIRCFYKYFDYPTYVSTKIVKQAKAEFPAVTICPKSSGFKEEILRENGIPSRKSYNLKFNLNWSSNDTKVSEEALFDLITYNLQELVEGVYIRYNGADLSDNESSSKYLNTSTDNVLGIFFTQQKHRSFGKCYTFYPTENMRTIGIYFIMFYFQREVKVYFHKHGQFMDFSGRMGYYIYENERVQSQVHVQDLRMLPNQGKDNQDDCSKDVHFDECLNEALVNHMIKNTTDENGCTVPWIINSTNICKNSKNINTTFWISWNRSTNQLKDCNDPCDTLKITLGKSNYIPPKNNQTSWILYFDSKTQLIEEHDLYPVLTLIAEIGGYTGLVRNIYWFMSLVFGVYFITFTRNVFDNFHV